MSPSLVDALSKADLFTWTTIRQEDNSLKIEVIIERRTVVVQSTYIFTTNLPTRLCLVQLFCYFVSREA